MVISVRDFLSTREQKIAGQQLASGFSSMHQRYKKGVEQEMFLASNEEVSAYIAVRRPATLRACQKALQRFVEREGLFQPAALLDIGSGPLTALEAVQSVWPESLQRAALVEAHPLFCRIIKEAAAQDDAIQLFSGDAADERLQKKVELFSPEYDLATLSYSLGEISQSALSSLMDWLLRISRAVVIVEPGTPRGWKKVMDARDRVIANSEWQLVAPCPHAERCPFMAEADGAGWCHESVRLERSSEHRRAKGARVGYEDEPFSYLVAMRQELVSNRSAFSRIVQAPQHRSGHSHFELCTPAGCFSKKSLSRKDGTRYASLKKAEWGDLFI